MVFLGQELESNRILNLNWNNNWSRKRIPCKRLVIKKLNSCILGQFIW